MNLDTLDQNSYLKIRKQRRKIEMNNIRKKHFQQDQQEQKSLNKFESSSANNYQQMKTQIQSLSELILQKLSSLNNNLHQAKSALKVLRIISFKYTNFIRVALEENLEFFMISLNQLIIREKTDLVMVNDAIWIIVNLLTDDMPLTTVSTLVQTQNLAKNIIDCMKIHANCEVAEEFSDLFQTAIHALANIASFSLTFGEEILQNDIIAYLRWLQQFKNDIFKNSLPTVIFMLNNIKYAVVDCTMISESKYITKLATICCKTQISEVCRKDCFSILSATSKLEVCTKFIYSQFFEQQLQNILISAYTNDTFHDLSQIAIEILMNMTKSSVSNYMYNEKMYVLFINIMKNINSSKYPQMKLNCLQILVNMTNQDDKPEQITEMGLNEDLIPGIKQNLLHDYESIMQTSELVNNLVRHSQLAVLMALLKSEIFQLLVQCLYIKPENSNTRCENIPALNAIECILKTQQLQKEPEYQKLCDSFNSNQIQEDLIKLEKSYQGSLKIKSIYTIIGAIDDKGYKKMEMEEEEEEELEFQI